MPGDGFFTDGGTNVSTPEDIGLVLEKIYMCQIAEKPFCEDMINLMTECADHSTLSQGIVGKSIKKFLNRFTTFFYIIRVWKRQRV